MVFIRGCLVFVPTLRRTSALVTESSQEIGLSRCAAECAVRFEPVCANVGFFATSTKCFRAGWVVGK